MTKRMLCMSLLLTLTAVHGQFSCVGKGIEASSFIASAGLQIAALGKECSYAEAKATCSEAVEKIISAFAYAAQLVSECVDTSACATDGTKAFHSLTVLFDMATSLRASADWSDKHPGICFRPPALNVKLLGDELATTASDLTNMAAKCDEGGDIDTQLGHCISKVMGTGVIVSAAGMAVDEAKDACKDTADRKCHLGRLFVANTLSLGAKEAVAAAKDCKADGLLDCGIDISTLSAKITDTATWGITMGSDLGAAERADLHRSTGANALAPRADLEAMGNSIAKISETIESSAQSCTPHSNAAEVKYGTCVSDAVSATAYLVSASMGIGLAVKDCAKKYASSQGLHEEVATCMGDVSVVIQSYASSTNEILWATADCTKEEQLDTKCASSMTMSMHAMAGAAGAAAALTSVVLEDDVTLLATVRDPVTGKTAVETLGGALDTLSTKLGDAVKHCSTTRRLHGAQNNTREHRTHAEKYAQKWNWGAKAKKWFNVQSRKEDTQTKSRVLTMGTVSAVAGTTTLGLVFLSIVVVSARLLSRRAKYQPAPTYGAGRRQEEPEEMFLQ